MQILNNYLNKHKSIDLLLSKEKVGAHLNVIQESLLYIGVLQKRKTPLFVVKENDVQVNLLKETLQSLNPDLDIVTFVYDASLRVEAISASDILKYDRVLALNKIVREDFDICLVDVVSSLRKISPKSILSTHQLSLRLNQELSMETLQKKLMKMGYQRVKYVEKPFTYAMRGGICDVFGVGMKNPLRIEFFDIEIDSM
ncbi:MAG TPA: transcription-repair coupling factor, partial [Erysipelothrix sp.]|nr:transcription-repair coupling factor [Erysipelothrix sp.]